MSYSRNVCHGLYLVAFLRDISLSFGVPALGKERRMYKRPKIITRLYLLCTFCAPDLEVLYILLLSILLIANTLV
jgi:hypothetical protein